MGNEAKGPCKLRCLLPYMNFQLRRGEAMDSEKPGHSADLATVHVRPQWPLRISGNAKVLAATL
jgi:hypothetical protein